MAKKKKKAKSKGSKQINALAPAISADDSLPDVQFHFREGFNYTTPSAQPRRSAEDRRKYGCEEIEHTVKGGKDKGKVRKKFTGRMRKDHPRGGEPDTYCKNTSSPCGDRASCPVQLVWVRGDPHLRFCITQGQPGHLVPVDSPEQAQAYAERACADWPKPKKKVPWPKNYFKKKAPFVVEDRVGLGEMQSSSWGWLLGGAAAAAGLLLLKRNQG